MPQTAFQINPPHTLNPRTDTSMMLACEGQKRGYDLWWYEPTSLTWESGELRASMQRITVNEMALRDGHENWYQSQETRIQPLAEMDVVWLRQDPPFDMGYITTTYLLEHAGTRVVNDPKGVRNAAEKLSPLAFAHYLPPTLISRDAQEITTFSAKHTAIVAKPLYGYGGRSVFKFARGDSNLETFLEFWLESSNEPLIWQAFLPEVAHGDRRILLINGEVRGCFGRTPHGDSIRANMRVGGEAVAADITPRQLEIATYVGKMARNMGLLIVGLDVIGDYLTEINVTSPTGLRPVEWLYGEDLAKEVWDCIT
jgi:glutathione synthase